MTNLEIAKNISEHIGNYCSHWNLPLTRFAVKSDIPYMTLKRIMACSVQKIDINTVLKIAAATNSEIAEVIGVDMAYLDFYKTFASTPDYNKEILLQMLDLLERFRYSGQEHRLIPFTDLYQDREGYIISPELITSDGVDLSRMEKTTMNSNFEEGITYMGLRLPDDRLTPYFYQGEILLIRNCDPMENDIGVYAYRSEGYVRILIRKVKLDGDFTVLLPITGRGREYKFNHTRVLDYVNWVKLGIVAGVVR